MCPADSPGRFRFAPKPRHIVRPPFPTLRYADPESADRYPLEIGGPAHWVPRASGCELAIELPPLTPGTLLVPSLALPAQAAEAPRSQRWTLESERGHWGLPPVPSERASLAPAASGPAVSTHIDCFRIHAALEQPRLRLELTGAPPSRYLAAVSARPFGSAAIAPPDRTARLERIPPARSQLTAPAAIAQRICSPTCVSMVLNHWGREHDWLALVENCLDRATGTYGVWPLALAAAARHGVTGAVEVFLDWNAALDVLARGVPLVTSIRFAAGELPGAPLDATQGHLVVLHGAGPDHVDVCDPAAAPEGVARRYAADAFGRAWLRQRGAAYILPA